MVNSNLAEVGENGQWENNQPRYQCALLFSHLFWVIEKHKCTFFYFQEF